MTYNSNPSLIVEAWIPIFFQNIQKYTHLIFYLTDFIIMWIQLRNYNHTSTNNNDYNNDSFDKINHNKSLSKRNALQSEKKFKIWLLKG